LKIIFKIIISQHIAGNNFFCLKQNNTKTPKLSIIPSVKQAKEENFGVVTNGVYL